MFGFFNSKKTRRVYPMNNRNSKNNNNTSKTRRNQGKKTIWHVHLRLVKKGQQNSKNVPTSKALNLNSVAHIETLITPLQDRLGSINRKDEIYVEELPRVSFDVTTPINKYTSKKQILEILMGISSVSEDQPYDYLRIEDEINISKKVV